MIVIKTHLHHILPPVPIPVIIFSIIWIVIFFLQVNAALLSQVAEGVAHVDQPDRGEKGRNWDQYVENDCACNEKDIIKLLLFTLMYARDINESLRICCGI